MKTKIRQALDKYILSVQSEINAIDHELVKSKNSQNTVVLNVANGYWQINEKPLSKCSIVKQIFFDQYLRMKFVKSPIIEQSSFKKRASEIKAKFNYNFKTREQNFLGDYPNIQTITFNRKIA